ncbi:MAG: hypothetical protein K8R23_04620 [Chthoniobacter sp.]|nr:hypothetical protein [Chthoniobacter sp.]
MAKHQAWLIGGLLIGCGAAGLAWFGYQRSLAPLQQSAREAGVATASLQERLEKARVAIQEVRTLESDAQSVRRQMDQLAMDLPDGPAAVWMPKLIKDHFAAFGLSVAIVRMNTVRAEPELPNFRRGYWAVGLPIVENTRSAAGTLLAVAEFEQQHPLVKVLDFAIRPDPENPQRRMALLNVAALIRK